VCTYEFPSLLEYYVGSSQGFGTDPICSFCGSINPSTATKEVVIKTICAEIIKQFVPAVPKVLQEYP